MASLQKNVSGQNLTFCMVVATTGAADPTGTGLAGKFTGDNAAQASCTGTFTNKGSGQYNYAPVQAETNFTDVGFLFTATGDIPVNIDFHTDLTDAGGNLQTDVVKWNGTAATGTVPPDAIFIRSGTAQAGSSSNTIILDAGASATNGLYNGEVVFIRSGTGAGQSAVITNYVGSTKVATIGGTWATLPDATSVFSVAAFGPGSASVAGTVNANVIQWNSTGVAGAVPPDTIFIRNGTAQAGSATSITLDAGASAVNNFYNNEVVFIRSGTGAGQSNIITSYVGATKVATVGQAWATNPDATSVFSVTAFGPGTAVVSGAVTANVTQWLGASVAATAAGIPDVNAKNINNVSAAAVTTISANQGTTQPINFTGTGGTALVKSDLTDIAGSPVSTTTAQIGSNLVNIAGSPVNTAAAQLGVNTVQLSGQPVSLDANSLLKVDIEDINGNALAGQALSQSARSICWGTASGGTTSTVIASVINNPPTIAASGQLVGRTIIFLGNTTTGGMQAQASNITANTTGATPTITFTVMTSAPVPGDVFVII